MADRAALFPGQGSQQVGMGAELAEAYPPARAMFERADEVLGFALSKLCWEGPEDRLTQTENAQPAILVHSLAAWSVVSDRLADIVRFAAGHSLGEFSAYAAAGSLEFDDAVRLVRRRGELMSAAREGTMAAVLKLEDGAVEDVCRRVRDEGGVVVAANFNAPGQVVISGEVEAVEKARTLATEAGARVKPLPVSGAFHSPLMAEAEAGLREALESVEFRDPRFPVVANATAEPISDADAARAALVRQLTAPVRWTESVRRIAAEGVTRYMEFGPGKVLTGLLKRIDGSLEGVGLGKPGDIESFNEGKA
ncbi:MAG: ACP S-malonyltransferase [Gemmatimonadetes bacterium]|uniref:Malonyl CoA-acyl carrier protein transacylase n=1 Tax=Candidatus Kutchimonas denitrificans TaxID=3056748 RepID=A0AAE4Z8H9_9BACT|nr:ACP S-malonyltransferase [Gemmatimonadota bacterium]NIR75229.1 ACP S-malonyltransferase [Candidatus Kutchimonas denitrificans]NIS00167.1 ACP S-malonyltransferase [Gemmatimonadota bacterium]NIT65759.1 ACP S-malonyltransferase [Gemmatimonadota bacterium]NIU53037.1 ACP S-malonyltransferase [Gemmatimonadota bacterium]